MSADVLWTGSQALTAEQQLARYAMAIEETQRNKKIQLDRFTPPSEEPMITISVVTYQFATTPEKKHLTIVATLPLDISSAQFARKPWLDVVQLGSESIPAAYGAP